MYIIHFSILLKQSTPLCNTSGEVTLLDIDTRENTQLQGPDVTVVGNVISFKLPTNRHYNITVIVSNNAGPSISYTTLSESHVLHNMLNCIAIADVHVLVLTPSGTHDILSAMVSQTENSAVTVTTKYSDHSTAQTVRQPKHGPAHSSDCSSGEGWGVSGLHICHQGRNGNTGV